MAKIVLGVGSSHGPLLTLSGPDWERRAEGDRKNPTLNMSDGRYISYDQLLEEVGPKYADVATEENFIRMEAICQKSLDRIAAELARVAPDLVVIIGDDQGELFNDTNMPCIAIFHGEEVATTDRWVSGPNTPEWVWHMCRSYGMDKVHRFPAAPEQGLRLIEGLMSRNVDIGVFSRIEDPSLRGFGHAFGFIVKRFFGDSNYPILPVLLNTYYPPNVMSPARAHDVGKLMREIIETQWPAELRVAVFASGGLSHFVTDVELDQRVLSGMEPGNEELLRTLPPAALREGSSEILNWVMMAGATQGLTKRWTEYHPIFRTPAGTGIGIAFGVWG
jgi:catalytic LigB subunit of aromatic ring-opening dioxygenase